ncbi:MAG: hypothetical protein Rubg2KO_13320 [Rubricoccaceae bacterium]
MTVRTLIAALVLLASAPTFAQTASPNAAPAIQGASWETADLELFVAASAEQMTVGETVTITVTVANRGDATAPDVQVAGPITSASIPDGLRLTAASSETGAFDPEAGLWYIGELAPEQEAALHIDFLVTAEGSYAFLSEVASAGVDDVDSTPYNGANHEDDIGSAGFSASR